MERTRKLKIGKGKRLHAALGVNPRKMNDFIERHNLLALPPTQSIKKVWESRLSEKEALYIIYTIGTAAGSEACSHEDDTEEYAAEEPEGTCKKCGVFKNYCVCGMDEDYIY